MNFWMTRHGWDALATFPLYPNQQQGWQCPICESVYAPYVVKCESCGEGKKPEMSVEQ